MKRDVWVPERLCVTDDQVVEFAPRKWLAKGEEEVEKREVGIPM